MAHQILTSRSGRQIILTEKMAQLLSDRNMRDRLDNYRGLKPETGEHLLTRTVSDHDLELYEIKLELKQQKIENELLKTKLEISQCKEELRVKSLMMKTVINSPVHERERQPMGSSPRPVRSSPMPMRSDHTPASSSHVPVNSHPTPVSSISVPANSRFSQSSQSSPLVAPEPARNHATVAIDNERYVNGEQFTNSVSERNIVPVYSSTPGYSKYATQVNFETHNNDEHLY